MNELHLLVIALCIGCLTGAAVPGFLLGAAVAVLVPNKYIGVPICLAAVGVVAEVAATFFDPRNGAMDVFGIPFFAIVAIPLTITTLLFYPLVIWAQAARAE